ncbi:MAG: folylpolyglutamate synthase/dihydrofolate synthase family protein [Dokdonia sp.]|jgi:dihydrofolate synthase/folylpolyglutamate synthase
MYQRQGARAYKVNLDNIELLMDYLEHPEKQFKSVHIAGTNGKGSTSHMLASVMQEAGYNIGLYTSPHLKDFRERIRINGDLASKQFVMGFVKKHKAFFEKHQLSFFEMTVGMAFSYFAQKKVDLAIVEVGLGGRLDATNILTPVLSIITNIGLDHTEFLGNTLAAIATEKAGIIKPEVPVVIGEYQPETVTVFETLSRKQKAPLHKAYNFDLMPMNSDLKGDYQQLNKRTVQVAISVLQGLGYAVGIQHIAMGLNKVTKNTGLLGRWQIIQEKPLLIADTAHNKEGLQLVMDQIANTAFSKLHLVFGVVKEKDLSSILPLLPTYASYYFCAPDVPRAMDAQHLMQQAQSYHLKGETYLSVKDALTAAQKAASETDMIFVGGSTFVVAEII